MVKKTSNDLHGSPYKGHSDTSERRADSASKPDSKRPSTSHAARPHALGSSNSSAIPKGADKISDDFYSSKNNLYITAKGMSYLADKLDEPGQDHGYDKGFSYTSTKAVDLSTLGSGGLWGLLHGGPDPTAYTNSNSTLATEQGDLVRSVKYWLTGDWHGNTNTYGAPVPVDEGLARNKSKTWWENYGTNDSGSRKGDFALGTIGDWLFAKSKTK